MNAQLSITKSTKIRLKIVGTRVDATEIVRFSSLLPVFLHGIDRLSLHSSPLARSRRTTSARSLEPNPPLPPSASAHLDFFLLSALSPSRTPLLYPSPLFPLLPTTTKQSRVDEPAILFLVFSSLLLSTSFRYLSTLFSFATRFLSRIV